MRLAIRLVLLALALGTLYYVVLGPNSPLIWTALRSTLSYRPPALPGGTQRIATKNDEPKPDAIAARKSKLDEPRSLWNEAEQQRFLQYLNGKTCETIVLPVQSQHFGFDRATRSLMTAEIAQALVRGSNGCVLDSYLASRALGDGLRRFLPEEISRLREAVHAKQIVTVYAGHTAMNMELLVQVERVGNIPPRVVKMWDKIPFTDEEPPFVKLQAMLSEVMTEVGLPTSKPTTDTNAPNTEALPASVHELITDTDGAAASVAKRYQVLGILGPDSEFRQTERFFEKSWLAAHDIADQAQSRRIQARALLHLGFRPAALAILVDHDPEDDLLRALANGNLPDAEQALSKVKSPIGKLIGAIEVRDLQWTYDRIKNSTPLPDVLVSQAAASPEWASLLDSRAGDHNAWHLSDNTSIKHILETRYPIDGYSLNQMAASSGVVDAPLQATDVDLSADRHMNKILQQHPDRFINVDFRLLPRAFDFLELLSGRAQANLEKHVVFSLFTKGQPHEALELLNAYDAQYAGHPHFALLRAETDERLLAEDHRADTEMQMRQSARAAAFWEQSATRYSFDAMRLTASLEYQGDFPPRPYWRVPIMKDWLKRTFAYSTNDLDGLKNLVELIANGQEEKNELVAKLEGRFAGSPEIATLKAKLTSDPYDRSGEIARMREMLNADPANSTLSLNLAAKLLEAGDYQGAADVANSHYRISAESGENRVALSNYMMGVGSGLYFRGEFKLASSLYEIAARNADGSDASLLSQQRLYGLSGNYAGYAQVARQRIERYDQDWPVRDYLAMLFALGYPKEAWAAFQKVAGRFDNTEIWHVAMVGHRAQGSTDEDVSKWLTSDSIKGIHIKNNAGLDQPALRFGLTYFMVDRPARPDLAALLARIEGDPQNVVDAGGRATMKPVGDHQFQALNTSAFRRAERAPLKEDEHVPSPFVLFASAYSAQRLGNHAAAVEAFDRLAGSYSIENGEFTFALPYFAMSAAKTGDKLGLESFIKKIPRDNQNFDFHLAMAVFDGAAHRSESAKAHLKEAFKIQPHSIGRAQLTPYQYAEACLWLFVETADPEYRNLALDWARKYQRIDPAFSWAYALDARFSESDSKDRLRAIGIADYLDRNSFWLSEIPAEERERGRVWFKQNNPFKQKLKSSADI